MKLVAREAIYVKGVAPKVRSRLIEKYTLRFYNEKACDRCEYKIERHSDICDQCAAYNGGASLGSVVKIKDERWLKLPAGDLPAISKALGYPKVVDKQIGAAEAPVKKKIGFAYSKLHDYQKDVIKKALQVKKGVVCSPPRTGKTVMGTALICKVGGKALILASQRSWLEGFYETFCRSKTQRIRFTDATGVGVSADKIKAWQKAGRPHRTIGFAKTWEDFQKLDVCLCTYQTFLSASGKKLLERLRNHFALVMVDEVHTANADQYAATISSLNSQFKIGLSGTPERKDGRDVIVEKLFGPVFIKTTVKQLRPTIHLTRTKFSYDKKNARWDQMLNSLEKDPKRLRLIAETALKDVKAGHMVLIPLQRVAAVGALTKAINKLAGKDIAAQYHGGVSKDMRTKVIEQARKYKVKVLVGNAKMISTGINIPRASMLYEITLSSNNPNAIQRFKRVLTPYDGKPEPGIRYFLDDMGVRRKCMSNEFWNAMMKECKPIFRGKDFELLKDYFANKAKFKMEL